MPLGLGDFLDVKDRRAVGLAHGIYPFRKHPDHGRVVPGFGGVNINAFPFFVGLEPPERFRDAAFCGLQFDGHGDAITVIPYKMAKGTCMTPAALTVSQKTPSEVLASPIVQKQTSFP